MSGNGFFGGIFNVESPFFVVMGKIWDMICLSLMWVLACFYLLILASLIPGAENILAGYFILFIFVQSLTVGPATTALYYAIVKVVRRERGYALRSFVSSFRLNLKQGAVVSAIIAVIVYILIIDFQYANALIENNSKSGQVFFYGSVSVTIILACMCVFMFPIMSRFSMRLLQMIKTTFFISMRHLFTSILAIIIVAVLVVVTIYFVPALMFSPAVCMLLVSLPMERVFKKYTPKDEEAEEKGKDEWYLE